MNIFFRLAVIVGALPVTLTNGTTADATQVMSDLNWIVNQVNANAAPLASTALVNANNNFTVVQSGVAATAPANFPIASQIQSSVFNTFQSTLGTNALTARMAALALTAWPTDGVFTFIPSQTNTGPANITVDSAGSSIIFSMGSTLVGGELRLGVPASIKRDATKLNLLNPANVRFDLASSTTTGGVRMLISATPAPISLGKQRTRQTFLSGTGTYTTPVGATRINVRLWGGGGGGGGGGAAGSSGGNTTFGPLTAGGGARNGGAAGTGTGGDLNLTGTLGGSASGIVTVAGGVGGPAQMNGGFGGAGQPSGGGGGTAPVNSGGGGGGGGGAAGAGSSGGSGGGYVDKDFVFPDPSYAFAVGAKGTGDAGGASAGTGGDGGSGLIIVEEYYN